MILDEIAERTKQRIEEQKKIVPIKKIREAALKIHRSFEFPFEKALAKKGIQFICEVKKASPSAGIIAEDFPYLEIAKEYEIAGAAAVSVLTEPFYFKGSDVYLKEIVQNIHIPVLRKDFVVDEYMIYEAKILGASAVLLICSILSPKTLRDYLELSHELGLSALVEAHDESEVIMAVEAGARIIGINNRNLKTFRVDMENSVRLREKVPSEILFVSESGIKSAEDVARLKQNGTDAVLIGETFMRAPMKWKNLLELRGYPCMKYCGVRTMEDIEGINRIEPDFIGFIFAESKRKVSKETAKILSQAVKNGILKVGVFVDEKEDTIIELLKENIIDLAQLHGRETEETIRNIQQKTGKKVIKTFQKNELENLEKINTCKADYLLFDSGSGSGETFDWKIIPKVTKPFFLAGGIDPENVAQAIQSTGCFAIDVSSGIETDGNKDFQKMKVLEERIRNE